MLLDVGQSFTQDVEQMYMALSIQLKTLNLIFDAIVDAGTLLKFIQRGKNVLCTASLMSRNYIFKAKQFTNSFFQVIEVAGSTVRLSKLNGAVDKR